LNATHAHPNGESISAPRIAIAVRRYCAAPSVTYAAPMTWTRTPPMETYASSCVNRNAHMPNPTATEVMPFRTQFRYWFSCAMYIDHAARSTSAGRGPSRVLWFWPPDAVPRGLDDDDDVAAGWRR
jgi:hypothetical protein